MYSAIIVGAGLGGVAAAVNLQKKGIEDFKVLDRADGLGGTWRSNSYPGCGCDTQMIAYQFSFSLNPDWDSLYPKAPQILEYIEDVVKERDLGSHFEFGVTVEDMVWIEDEQHWVVNTDKGEYRARNVYSALGQFHTACIPSLPGLDEFEGDSMHSGAWNHDVSFEGKRVAVVGSAASAVQLIPEVAKVVSEMTVFQRTPNWVISRGDRVVEDAERSILRSLPEVVEVNRTFALDNADALLWPIFSYKKEVRDYFTALAKAHLEAQVSDPDLRARLTPNYPLGCKRLLLSDDFYPTLMLDHVTLEDQAITRVESNGVVTVDGTLHEVDIIVWATGFESTGWQEHVPVRGVGGLDLADAWKKEPKTLLGVVAHHFPNMYFAYGPNTNLGHGPVTYMLERQAEFFARMMSDMAERDVQVAMVREDIVDSYHKELHEALEQSTWADPSCDSYYKNALGLVDKNWMGSMEEYRTMLENTDLESFELLEARQLTQ